MTIPDDIESDISQAIELDDANALRQTIESSNLIGHEDLGAWLTLAANLGSLNAMHVLLDSDANVLWKNEDGETAFSFACVCDQFDAARLLHKHGADINSVDSSGGTPLDWAVCHARPAFREWLKSVGGNRNSDHEEWPWPPRTHNCDT
ncbi:ankyrin repeat domain-containing protein [Novipirellula sp. SH528]|uniref:ankyrin repeat domain-containing protein n=1 Tax=Novipirellula sp. SH528 TaxID=3454466 RepID=UPI003F9EDA82